MNNRRQNQNNPEDEAEMMEVPEDAVDALNQSSTAARASHRGLIPRARVKVFNLSLAYAITYLVSNVPYVAFEVIIASKKESMISPVMSAIMGEKILIKN